MTSEVRFGDIPLVSAARGDEENVRALLHAGMSPNYTNDEGVRLLDIAVASDKLNVVRCLSSYGANANAMNSSGWTALHAAANLGLVDMTVLLIAIGADVNAQTIMCGETPLILAAQNCNMALIKILIESGADSSCRDSTNRSASDYLKECDTKPVGDAISQALRFLCGDDSTTELPPLSTSPH